MGWAERFTNEWRTPRQHPAIPARAHGARARPEREALERHLPQNRCKTGGATQPQFINVACYLTYSNIYISYVLYATRS
jgi:hypothetical protein